MDYGIAAFLDVLGFSEMVERDSRGDPPTYLSTFARVIEAAEERLGLSGLSAKMFSDSIVLAGPLTPNSVVEVIEAVAQLQISFLGEGILVRGGVAFGKHYEDSRILYSQALVNAYEIESKLARFPRVVISNDTIDYAWNHTSTDEILRQRIREIVVMDKDRQYFVDYLSGGDMSILREQVRAVVAPSATTAAVMEKLRWLLDYCNYCLGENELQQIGDVSLALGKV